MSTRSYAEAVDALNSLQSNAAAIETIRTSESRTIPDMLEYLHRIGHSVSSGLAVVVQSRDFVIIQASDLNRLNVVHITGTKGKGSTSAFTDSILRHAKPEWKIGEIFRAFGSPRPLSYCHSN